MKKFSRFSMPMTFTVFFKRNLAASVLALQGALMSFPAMAELEVFSKPRAEAKSFQLAPVSAENSSLEHFYSQTSLDVGRWQIPGYWYEVRASYLCRSWREYGFWPVLGECWGNLQLIIPRDQLTKLFEQKKAALEAQEKDENKKNPFLGLLNHGKYQSELDSLISEHQMHIANTRGGDALVLSKPTQDFSGIFQDLGKGDHVIYIDGKAYELQDFPRISASGMASVVDEAKDRVSIARNRLIFDVVIGSLIGAIGIYLFILLIRRVPRYMAKLRAALQSRAAKLKAAHQRHKVRGVMMDETIRVATRDALQSADAQSREVLIAELRKAIESGNHELANALELALKKA